MPRDPYNPRPRLSDGQLDQTRALALVGLDSLQEEYTELINVLEGRAHPGDIKDAKESLTLICDVIRQGIVL